MTCVRRKGVRVAAIRDRPPFDADDRTLADVLAAYDAQCRRSDEILAAHELTATGVGSGYY